MLVDNPSGRRFERRGGGPRRLLDILIDKAAESFRCVPRDRGMKEKEQLILPLRELANRREQNGDIMLLLPLDLRRRVFPRRRQVRTVLGTIDLDQTFGRAADGADGLAECRTRSAAIALTTRRALHRSSFAQVSTRSLLREHWLS